VTKLIACLLILAVSNVVAWFQLNGQFKWIESPYWTSPFWMALFGLPVGLAFFYATRLSYEHFGFTWNMRLIGFGVGTIIFGILSYAFLEEIPTLKTFICILLAVAIILIQITNVIGE
jgi:hypothetical protein|tara:strand:- start:359 stop:712 length:354 start_codon:yes stop_codon:yes gene_type:complete